MKKKLLEIAQKYSLKDIKEQVDNLSHNLTLSIGFLGEFSSGKSTLINALIGKKILPAMEEPTTKSITEIIPTSSVETMKFFEKQDNGELIPLDPLDFQEIAMGRKEGKAVIKIKPSDILQENYLVIDTPGISSLDKMDIDITYGYLPFVDGAVICQDINYGILTDSIINVLSMPTVKPIANNFIFALTKADTKSKEAAETVRKNVINLLVDKSDELGLDAKNIEDRVVVISALKALEDKENSHSYIGEIKRAIKNIILNKKKSMLKHREQIKLEGIAEQTIAILTNIKENLSETDESLEEKEKEIKTEIEKLEEEKKKFSKKLSKFKDRLCNSLDKIAERYAPAFSGIQGKEDVQSIISEMLTEITSTTQRQTNAFMEGIEIPNLKYVAEDFKASIINAMKFVDTGKLIGTAVITAWLIPGAGTADVAQGVGGGAMVKAKNIGKALKGAEALKEIGKNTTEQAKKSGKFKEFLVKAFEVVGDFEKQVNPLEYVGDFIKQRVVSGKAKTNLNRIASQVCYEVSDEVEEQTNDIVFSKLESQLRSQYAAMDAIKREKLNKIKDTLKTKKQIDDYISEFRSKRNSETP